MDTKNAHPEILEEVRYDAVLKTLRKYAKQGFRIKIRGTSCDNTDFIYVLENEFGDKIELWFPISASNLNNLRLVKR